MPVKYIPPSKTVNLKEMKDGEIAVFVSGMPEHHIGKVIYRYGNDLVELGTARSESKFWPNLITNDNVQDVFVTILPKGSLLEIT